MEDQVGVAGVDEISSGVAQEAARNVQTTRTSQTMRRGQFPVSAPIYDAPSVRTSARLRSLRFKPCTLTLILGF